MRAVALLAALVAVASASDAIVVENGAICVNKATGFFVVDNTELTSQDTIVYKDTPEEECLRTCSQNRDQFGRSILCASFVYDHKLLSCTIYKEKSEPEGQAVAITAIGKRYFEKICLKEDVPMHCAESQFIRADQSVLVGFATEVQQMDTLEACVAHCTKNSTCKSAMYYWDEHECITNSESGLSKPDAFHAEKDDNVIYFQNGCPDMPNVQVEPPTQRPSSDNSEARQIKNDEEYVDEKEGSADDVATESTTLETTVETTTLTTEGTEATTQITTDAPKSTEVSEELSKELSTDSLEVATTTKATSETHTKKSSTESTEHDEEIDEEFDAIEPTTAATTTSAETTTEEHIDHDDDTEDDDDEDDSVPTPAAKKPAYREKYEGKTGHIKYIKHPRNFGSKTIKAIKQAQLKESTTDEFSIDEATDIEDEEVEPLSQEEGAEPLEGETKPLMKRNRLMKIKKVALPEETEPASEEVKEFPNYFSEWSDWTPCTKSGERQIRRRKCLDLRRCLGALMQVQNCPAIIATPAPGPIESVRSLVGATDYDEPQSPVRSAPNLPPVPIHSNGEPIWSPWLGTCQQFASGQPCNAGQMIGFESRECVAKEPTACEGPFFRYCTLPC